MLPRTQSTATRSAPVRCRTPEGEMSSIVFSSLVIVSPGFSPHPREEEIYRYSSDFLHLDGVKIFAKWAAKGSGTDVRPLPWKAESQFRVVAGGNMRCRKCGSDNRKGRRFCAKC